MPQTDIDIDLPPTPEDTIAAAIAKGAIDGRLCSAEERAAEIAQALRSAGFQILPPDAESRRRYQEALELVRGPMPTVGFVAEILGSASPDGPEGNVWDLLDAAYAEFVE